ncbi:WD40 repeat domain-containing protein [Desulfurococcaceae archaeon MEX13E-LK6-19]|nr:WD40 repeat domain-containing protein [Desulfurococcaceae archaeon MEX13E-LK6-19]
MSKYMILALVLLLAVMVPSISVAAEDNDSVPRMMFSRTYGTDTWSLSWISDELLMYSEGYGFISLINVSSGETKTIYVGELATSFVQGILVGGDKIFLINSNGDGGLYSLPQEKLLWLKKGVYGFMDLLGVYSNRVVLANYTHIIIVNPFSGTTDVVKETSGIRHTLRSGYVKYRDYYNQNYYIRVYSIDTGITREVKLDDPGKNDIDPNLDVLITYYDNGTLVKRSISTGNELDRRTLWYITYADIVVDSVDHKILLVTSNKIYVIDIATLYIEKMVGHSANGIHSIGLSPSEKYYAVLSPGNGIYVYRVDSMVLVYRSGDLTTSLYDTYWLDDKHLIAYGYDAGKNAYAVIYDVNGSIISTYESSHAPGKVIVRDDTLYLISYAGDELYVMEHDLENGFLKDYKVFELPDYINYLNWVCLTDGKLVVEYSYVDDFFWMVYTHIVVFDYAGGYEVYRIDHSPGMLNIVVLNGTVVRGTTPEVIGDISLPTRDRVYEYNIETGEVTQLYDYNGFSENYSQKLDARLAGNGKTLAVVKYTIEQGLRKPGLDIYIVDINTGNTLLELSIDDYVYMGGMTWSNDNETLILALNNKLLFLNTSSGNYYMEPVKINWFVKKLSYSPSGYYMSILTHSLYSLSVYQLKETPVQEPPTETVTKTVTTTKTSTVTETTTETKTETATIRDTTTVTEETTVTETITNTVTQEVSGGQDNAILYMMVGAFAAVIAVQAYYIMKLKKG